MDVYFLEYKHFKELKSFFIVLKLQVILNIANSEGNLMSKYFLKINIKNYFYSISL